MDRCNASVIIIDTGQLLIGGKNPIIQLIKIIGISSAYGGVLSALEILYTLTPLETHPPDHRQDPFLATSNITERDQVVRTLKKGKKYMEREEVYAVYEKRKDVIRIEEREVVL